MAIAYDNYTEATAASSTATVTQAHTVTGSNPIIFVGIVNLNTGALSTVTYNGNAMTLISSQTGAGATIYLYYSLGVATGSHNVVVTRGTTTNAMYVKIYSATGVNQGGQPNATTGSFAPSVTSITETVTTLSESCWAVLLAYTDNGQGSAGTNSTLRGTWQGGTGLAGFMDTSGFGPITKGSFGMTANSGVTTNLFGIIAVFSPTATFSVIDTLNSGEIVSPQFSVSTLDSIGSNDNSNKMRSGWQNQSANNSTWSNQQQS